MYQPRTESWAHQKQALSLIKDKDCFALLMEMGTGKTKVILDEFSELVSTGRGSNLLIVAPAGSYRNWARECEEHLDQRLYEKLEIAIWQSGRTKAPIEKLLKLHDRPRVLIVNIEALSRVELAKETCDAFLSDGATMMVVDESTRIKNIDSKRTENVLELGKKARWR